MSEHEQPQAGGSYIRGKDGALTRSGQQAADSPVAEAGSEPKPQGKTTKKDK